jgi:hypothetical protein
MCSTETNMLFFIRVKMCKKIVGVLLSLSLSLSVHICAKLEALLMMIMSHTIQTTSYVYILSSFDKRQHTHEDKDTDK